MRRMHTTALVTVVLTSALAAQTPAPHDAVTPGIAGVIAAGSRIQPIWSGFISADGVIGDRDGTVLVTHQAANTVSRIDGHDRFATVYGNTNGAGALAIDHKGRLIALERTRSRIEMLAPIRKVLVDSFEAKPLGHLSDLVVDKNEGIYFTDGRAWPKENSVIYYIKPNGQTVLATDKVARANGVLLSPDEKTMYVTDTPGEYLVTFDVNPDGTVKNRRDFAKVGKGGDGLAIDVHGRIYVAMQGDVASIVVVGADGKILGTIPAPRPVTSIAFAGANRKTLYIVGRGADGTGDREWARTIYKVPMLVEGIQTRAK